MSKTMGFNRDKFMAKAQNLFEAAGKAPVKEYKSLSGHEYAECPGAYNDYMVRSMCGDMTQAWIALKNTPFEKRIQSWMPKMTAFNTEVMRMMDDLNGDRPVKAQNLKKWNKLRAEIQDIMRAPEVADCYISDLAERMKVWDERLAYQLAWIYYLRENHHMNYFEKQLGWTEDGSDKSPMTGLTPDEEGQVKNIIEIRRIILDTYLRIPVNTPEHRECLSKLEDLARAMDTILNHAADDFKEDNEEAPEKDERPLVEDNETAEKELSDVLTAIRTVAGQIDTKLTGREHTASLQDKITTAKTLLIRLEQKSKDDKDYPTIVKGASTLLKSVADDLEMEYILS